MSDEMVRDKRHHGTLVEREDHHRGVQGTMLTADRTTGLLKRVTALCILCVLMKEAGADMSQAELLGSTAGRVLGGAQACGTPSERLQTTARRAFAAIDHLAQSEPDRASADNRMRDGLRRGARDIKAGQTSCETILSSLGKLEKRLGQR